MCDSPLLPLHPCLPLSLPLTSSLSPDLGHGYWSVSAFSVGVFDGLSPLLTALWVSRDKSKGWKGISPFIYGLGLIWYACRGICKQTIMFLICMKAYFLLFCPVTLMNLLNQCALLLWSYVCRSAGGCRLRDL